MVSKTGILFKQQAVRVILRILTAAGLLLFAVSPQLHSQVITNNGASVSVTNGTVVGTRDVVNTAGTLTNSGTVNMAGSFTSTATTNGSTGTFRLGGNWTNNGIFTPGNSMVIFNGTVNQIITRPGGETFNNISLENTGTAGLNYLNLSNNVTVLGTLSMSTGNINTGAGRLLLFGGIPGALDYRSTTRSRILGRFERGISQQGTYLFPMGTAAHYNAANITANTLPSSGTVMAQFLTPPSIDSTGLPFADPPDEVARVWQDGYWLFTSFNGLSVTDFNINLKASGFSSFQIQDITRVIRRNAGTPDWITTDGSHSPATPSDSVVYRNNLKAGISASGTQFALGQSRPRILKHPRDTAACEISDVEFEVRASSTRTLTYTWYKEPAIPLVGPRYVTPGPGILIIRNLVLSDAGNYYCIVTDDYGNWTRTNSATLIVNKRPAATVTPNSQDHECSNVTIDNIVLGESNGVPGTYYRWRRNTPAGIVTAFPENGTVANIGGMISGAMFTNITDSPIPVTFSITPFGPLPTDCEGQTVTTTIYINPTPRVIPNNLRPEICNNGTTSIRLESNSIFTQGAIVFDFSATATGGGSVTGDLSSMSDRPMNFSISRTYGNSSSALQTVTYTITPKISTLICPNGLQVQTTAGVHANPLQGITVVKQLTCDGGSDATLNAVYSTGAAPYTAYWEGPFGTEFYTQTITGLTAGAYTATITDNLGCNNNDFYVISGPRIDPYFNVNVDVSCPGGSDGSVIVGVFNSSTANPPYYYWIVKDDQDTIINNGVLLTEGTYITHGGLRAGNYKLHIRDNNFCYKYPETPVGQPDPITVRFDSSRYAGGFNISCLGYSDGWARAIPSGGTAPYSYSWTALSGSITGPANGDIINGCTAGVFVVLVTDANSCQMRDTVTLIEPAGMSLASSEVSIAKDGTFNISCNGGNDGYIKMTIAGGSGSFSYSWTRNGVPISFNTKDISGLTAGIYQATVKDLSNPVNPCELLPKPTFTLADPPVLNVIATPSYSVQGAHSINCAGGTGSITLTVTGGVAGTYKYDWSTTNGSGIVPGVKDQGALTAGSYTVIVSDINEVCRVTRNITLTQPAAVSISLVPTDITCISPGLSNGSVDLSVSGGVSPYTYLWSNGATTQDLSSLTAGSYSVTVTDANGCTSTGSAVVNNPPPIAFTSVISDYNGFNISCYGYSNGSIRVTPTSGDPPFVYNWSGPSGFSALTPEITGLSSGIYTLVITDKNMCTATAQFTLTDPGRLYAGASISQSSNGGYNINCAGGATGTITLNPVNVVVGATYLWSDGYTDGVRTNLMAGSYKVIILDVNNCHTDTTIVLTDPDSIKLSFSVRQAFCPDSPDGEITVTATGGVPAGDYTYLWSNGATTPVITNILKGDYTVKVTDGNGCSVSDSISVEPQNESCLVVPNAISPNDDNINDIWNIGMKHLYPKMEVRVYNRWGETVWRSASGYPDPWDGKSNGIKLPMDSYHYVIDLHNGSKPIIGSITILR